VFERGLLSEHEIDTRKLRIEEQGSDELSGLGGLQSQIYAKVEAIIEDEIAVIATNKALHDVSSELIVNELLSGIRRLLDTLSQEDVVNALEKYRKEH